MPLVKASLDSQIKAALLPKINSISKDAFKAAMEKFNSVSAEQNGGNEGTDVFSDANNQAATEFAKIMKDLAGEISKAVADSVDLFVKSATITIPPGQIVAAPPPAGAGTVVAPFPLPPGSIA
jgi:hypothetical protein